MNNPHSPSSGRSRAKPGNGLGLGDDTVGENLPSGDQGERTPGGTGRTQRAGDAAARSSDQQEAPAGNPASGIGGSSRDSDKLHVAAGHVHREAVDASRYAHIPGWGADRVKQDRPAVPMERTPPRLEGVHWDMPEPQHSHVEVLHSVERPGLTPVYGTTAPPRGVSGALRRLGFRYSENDLRRWLILLMADRVDMVEGLFEDVSRGHVPRVYAEMGGRAELKHNPGGAVRKAATVVAVAGVAYWLWQRRSRDSND